MFNQISFFADLQQQQACYVDKKFKYQKKKNTERHTLLSIFRSTYYDWLRAIVLCFTTTFSDNLNAHGWWNQFIYWH